MLLQGQSGQQNNSDGAITNVRLTKQGDVAVSEVHPRYYESTYRGNTFSLDSDSVTLAAAHATKGALATVKFITGFWNPNGSGKNAVIISSHVATVSGTPAGPYFYNYLPGSTNTAAATGTIRNLLLSTSGGSAMYALVSVVLGAIGAPTTAMLQLGVQGGPAAIAAGAGVYDSYEEVAGRIIVPPGCLFGICALGAGTSHVVQSTLTWEEVNI